MVEISTITGTEQPNRHGLCWRVRRFTLSSLERLDGALSRRWRVLVEQLLNAQQTNVAPTQTAQLPALSNVECFDLDDQSGKNIESWIDRFVLALDCSSPNIQDQLKVKLVLTKLGEGAYNEYSKYCLPKKPTEFDFSETPAQLKCLFAKPQSVWIDRYECLRAAKQDDEDFRAFVNRHKRLLRDFEFKKLNEEQFNCLMLLIALKSPKDAELRKRILGKLTADGDKAKYDNVVSDLQMFLSTIAEAKAIERPSHSNVLAINRKQFQKREPNKSPTQPTCWRCGSGHEPRSCPHSKATCRKCSKVGHLQNMCARHREWLSKHSRKPTQGKQMNALQLGGISVNALNQPSRLVEAPVDVNGKPIDFVFDPGAEITVIDEESHHQIGRPRLIQCSESAKYHDGTECTLLGKGFATFTFGGRTHQGQFYVKIVSLLHFGKLQPDKLRGAGVGALFRSLMRYLLPIGKQIGSAIGRQGMESGNRVLTNVLEGKDLKESLVSEIPPTNVSVVRSFFRQVLPLATITQESPYLFRLYSDNLWTDLSRIYLYLELSIEKPGANDKWVAIEDTDTSVSAIQGIGQTFVQQLKVTVGNTEVYDSGNLYPFKAYITNELSFPVNAKKNFLSSTGYYHTVNQDDSTDDGFKERCKIFKGGKNAQFLSRLDFDLGNQELYLLNNLDLLFTIYKAKDVFLLQTLKANDSTKYRLTVHDVKIYAKMVEVQPSLNMSLYKTLEKQPATYAVRKTEIKSSFISVGRYEFEYNVFSATIPRRVIIALVGNSAFHGDYKLSPFMFEPFDLREISVHAGGIVYPAVPYKLNFSNDHFVTAFVDMYEALGMANSERSFDISMAQFKKGWSFFVIPLTSTLDDSCGFELLRSGSTNVRATFNSPIPLGGVEMIVLGEFDQMIMVDYNRHIVTDSKLG
ncbi:hypothetical protein niasHT_036032 [Heterodera trifolii]|uniref:DUF7083 domain-containing protein n=1 Tax=Heterodera trifolii TaxID=157864 RepID=A0ABD2I1L7_9BILA